MLRPLDLCNDVTKIYSFGKVIFMAKERRYHVQYKNKIIKIVTDERLQINTWIRFYGAVKNDEVYTFFIGKLNGIDMNIFEKAVNYVGERLERSGNSVSF